MRLVTGALLLLWWLAGCASAPLHYYTLSSLPRQGTAPPLQLTAPLSLERLSIPMELDRTQLVRRLDATRLQILDDHRWAAPLEDMMRRVLSEDLALRLGSGAIAEPEAPTGSEQREALAVDIRELYGDVDCAVTLHAAWSLRLTAAVREPRSAAGGGPPASDKVTPASDLSAAQPHARRGEEEIHVSSGSCSGPAGLPPQISQALADLSDRIVSALLH